MILGLHVFFKKASSLVRLLLVSFLSFYTEACVTVRSPEGGPQDTVPPKLIHTYPANMSKQFQGTTLKLTFDKAICVQNIYQQLLITPSLKKPQNNPLYTYKVSGKTLTLTLNTQLDNDTTYTFNFNNAVQSLTESVPAQDLVIAFSTGKKIDDLYVKGRVTDLLTTRPVKGAIVALYKAERDLTKEHILTTNPDYFTNTDQEGNFQLTAIRKGAYRIYAGKSKENKVVIDPSSEPYGFLPAPIKLLAPIDGIELSIVKADVSEFKLQSKQAQEQYFELGFSKPVVSYTLTLLQEGSALEEPVKLYSNLVNENRIIRVYDTLGLLEEDSVTATLIAKDNLDNVIEETLKIHFKEKEDQKIPLLGNAIPAVGTVIAQDFVGTIIFNKPIKFFLPNKLVFIINNQKFVPVSQEDYHFKEGEDRITLQKRFANFLAGQESVGVTAGQASLVLYMAEGCVVDVEGECNSEMNYYYLFKDMRAGGTIRGIVTTDAPGFLLQLLNAADEVIDEIRNEKHYCFQFVEAGEYRLRMLVCRNKNAPWHFGNIEQLEQPDPIVWYPAKITMLDNWELENIDLNF